MGLIIGVGIVAVFLSSVFITMMCVATKKPTNIQYGHIPKAYNRLSSVSSSQPSINGSHPSMADLTGDPYNVYLIPTGVQGGTDKFTWKRLNEGFAPYEEKHISIERIHYSDI